MGLGKSQFIHEADSFGTPPPCGTVDDVFLVFVKSCHLVFKSSICKIQLEGFTYLTVGDLFRGPDIKLHDIGMVGHHLLCSGYIHI